jgi:dipeptidyl aminopeptidase/acylaminoacyl peptidase
LNSRAWRQNLPIDLRLAGGPFLRMIRSLASGRVMDKRVYIDRVGQAVSFPGKGVTLAGTLCRPAAAGRHPGVLLLHGSTPQGRKLGLYRLLSRGLTGRGYVVLNIDLRGYGDSDDPPRADRAESFDFIGDTHCAVTYLGTLDGVDPGRLFIVGHSFGANIAITTAIESPAIRAIVALGPSRRFKERVATELDYFRRRTMRYMGLPDPIPTGIYLQIEPPHLDDHQSYFADPDHKPLLLVDGSRESDPDRSFLQRLYDSMAAPKAYITLPESDHYANVLNIGPLVIYDARAAERLIREIDKWLSRQ